MDLGQIRELIQTLEASRLKKLFYKKGDLELCLEKEESVHSNLPPQQVLSCAPHEGALQSPSPASSLPNEQLSLIYVTSPMVGTFYTAPSPDEALFVKVGDRVSPQTVVCIVEAMKVLNEVKAGVSGTVAEILVENAQPVEFGTKLFRIV